MKNDRNTPGCKHKQRHTHVQRGMTLIEVIVTVGILMLAFSIISVFINSLYRMHGESIGLAYSLSEARQGVDQLVRDIREASYSDDGSFPLVAIDANEFIFFSDVDRDSSTERIRYYLDDEKLMRGSTDSAGSPPTYDLGTEVTGIVASDVRNASSSVPIFRYYNESGTEIVDYDDVLDVSFVEVRLLVNTNPVWRPQDTELYSSATIRNLKRNL